MDFSDQIRELCATFEKIKDDIKTEEATKHGMVMRFMQALGYDVFNPREVVPEFTADIGTKKGEKVDYAIMIDGLPLMLIESKCVGCELDPHTSQLLRYFSVTKSRFAILTNGIQYQFFTDLDEKNKMDTKPFLSVELCPEIRDTEIAELKKFHKSYFDADQIMSSALELKYTGEIKRYFRDQLAKPEEDFIRFFLKKVYSGTVVNKNVLERFGPTVHNALRQHIYEVVSDRLKSALAEAQQKELETPPAPSMPADNMVVTTQDELEAYHIVRAILGKHIDPEMVQYKDTKSYFSINYGESTTKWICRISATTNKKSICLRTSDAKHPWHGLDSFNDLYPMEAQLLEALQLAMGSQQA